MIRFRLNLRLALVDSSGEAVETESSLIPDANTDEEAVANGLVRVTQVCLTNTNDGRRL